MLVRLSVSEERPDCGVGLTVKVAVFVTLPSEAEMLVAVGVTTGEVVIAKLAVLAPCATGTLAGTVTAVDAIDSGTRTPPDGAAPGGGKVPGAGVRAT